MAGCLKGSKLNNANLYDADFRGGTVMSAGGQTEGSKSTDLTDCMLDFATMARAEMTGANLNGTSLISANLRGAKLTGVRLGKTDLTTCSMEGTRFS